MERQICIERNYYYLCVMDDLHNIVELISAMEGLQKYLEEKKPVREALMKKMLLLEKYLEDKYGTQ